MPLRARSSFLRSRSNSGPSSCCCCASRSALDAAALEDRSPTADARSDPAPAADADPGLPVVLARSAEFVEARSTDADPGRLAAAEVGPGPEPAPEPPAARAPIPSALPSASDAERRCAWSWTWDSADESSGAGKRCVSASASRAADARTYSIEGVSIEGKGWTL